MTLVGETGEETANPGTVAAPHHHIVPESMEEVLAPSGDVIIGIGGARS
jgi:hypothetical protein